MNTSPLTVKQNLCLDMVEDLRKRFDENRWFTKHELPGIILHTTKKLVEKGYFDQCIVGEVIYYRLIKEKQVINGNIVYTDIPPTDKTLIDVRDGIVVTIEYPRELYESDAIDATREFLIKENML